MNKYNATQFENTKIRKHNIFMIFQAICVLKFVLCGYDSFPLGNSGTVQCDQ
jgi:hypothetical protein